MLKISKFFRTVLHRFLVLAMTTGIATADELSDSQAELHRQYDRYYEASRSSGKDPEKVRAAARAIEEAQSRIRVLLDRNREKFFENLATLEFHPDGTVKRLSPTEQSEIRKAKPEPLEKGELMAEEIPGPKMRKDTRKEAPTTRTASAPAPAASPTPQETPQINDAEGARQLVFPGKRNTPKPTPTAPSR